MSETTETTTSTEPDVAWRLLLGAVAVALILVSFVVQITQEATIPPLIVLDVLLVIGMVLLLVRPRIGAITVGVLSVLMVLFNLPFIASRPPAPRVLLVVRADRHRPDRRAGRCVRGSCRSSVGPRVVRRGSSAVWPSPRSWASSPSPSCSRAVRTTTSSRTATSGCSPRTSSSSPTTLTAPAGDIGIYIGNDDLVRHNIHDRRPRHRRGTALQGLRPVRPRRLQPGTYDLLLRHRGPRGHEGNPDRPVTGRPPWVTAS